MAGNSYIATYERHSRPDQSGVTGPGAHWPDFSRTGWIQSDAFRITRNRIGLLVGGGNLPEEEYVALLRESDDAVLFTETGEESHVMSERIWDCSTLRGERVYLVIADLSAADWGCISVDEIQEYEETVRAGDARTPAAEGRYLPGFINR